MTVAELIFALSKFDPALPVVTPGFDEGGFDLVAKPEEVEIVQVNDGRQHSDQFEDVRCLLAYQRPIGEPFTAVAISF